MGTTADPNSSEAIKQGTATLVEHSCRIHWLRTMVGFFGHAVGESNADFKVLIGGRQLFSRSHFMLPTRNTELLRWSLEKGLRINQSMTLMNIGLYNEPAGAFLPSIIYLLNGALVDERQPASPNLTRREYGSGREAVHVQDDAYLRTSISKRRPLCQN